MKNYDEKHALSIILDCAKAYDEKLNNKHFLIVYQEKHLIKTCCVGFRDMNFLHLTGVKTKISAQQFYSACLERRLSVKDISVDTKGKVQQKLAVLPYLSELLYNNCMIGNFINSGIAIRADYFVGDTRAVISIGFREGKTADIPVTLYCEDIRKLSYPTCKVLAIFSKEYNMEKYNSCTYLSKGYSVEKLPETVKVKLNNIENENTENRDMCKALEDLYNDGVALGQAKGMAEGIIDLLSDYGDISEELKNRIYAETDLDVLKRWHKLSARVSSIEEFEQSMNQV